MIMDDHRHLPPLSLYKLGPERPPQDVWVFDADGHRRALLPVEVMYEEGYVWIHDRWFETDDSTFVGFKFVNAPKLTPETREEE